VSTFVLPSSRIFGFKYVNIFKASMVHMPTSVVKSRNPTISCVPLLLEGERSLAILVVHVDDVVTLEVQ
jgi:hypothetical protein